MDLKTELRNNIVGWETSIEVRNSIRLDVKSQVKLKEQELKQLKYYLGQRTKLWVEARKELKKAKRRLSSIDWKVRKYAKDNLGKVLNKLEEGVQ